MTDFEFEAQRLGIKAFYKGSSRFAGSSIEFTEFLKNHRGQVKPCLNAWVSGWDMADQSKD